MIYLRAGVYAEGPSDYHFLLRLLDRHLDALAAPLFGGNYEVADTLGIDAPPGAAGPRRADRIAAAITEHADSCGLFVVHTDGASDPGNARATCVDPGVAAARAALPEREVIVAACIPVREIEAWLLTDIEAFRTLLGKTFDRPLPADPEKEIDPKATLRRIIQEGGGRGNLASIHALFGERVSLASLRRLPAFQVFEAELVEAIKRVARVQGQRI